MYGEQAFKLDPLSEWIRRSLIIDYIDADDPIAARQIADEAPHQLPIQRPFLYVHQGDWRRAAEVTYSALADGTMTPINEPSGTVALRMNSRATGEFRRTRAGPCKAGRRRPFPGDLSLTRRCPPVAVKRGARGSADWPEPGDR